MTVVSIIFCLKKKKSLCKDLLDVILCVRYTLTAQSKGLGAAALQNSPALLGPVYMQAGNPLGRVARLGGVKKNLRLHAILPPWGAG